MYIDPHVHMVSRTTDDYQRMALAGCVAITEPAFWDGGLALLEELRLREVRAWMVNGGERSDLGTA